jgi:hypothetical protein
MICENQKNIKIHFAGCEVMNKYIPLAELNVRYTLYTAFPFLERHCFTKPKSPLMPCHLKHNPNLIPQFIKSNSQHCIQDSGLFTLMFGSQKGERGEQFMDKWYNELINFSAEYSKGITIVEVDCQKVLGVKKAWEYRKRLKADLPNNRQINVFHKEDKQKGLDELIEFSDYIAISVPELRFLKQSNYVVKIANYIKNKKPDIDIHLLGCTEKKLLVQLKFCTSSDSTSWVAGQRYGHIQGYYNKYIKKEKTLNLYGEEKFNNIRKWNSEINSLGLILAIHYHKQLYTNLVGDQN